MLVMSVAMNLHMPKWHAFLMTSHWPHASPQGKLRHSASRDKRPNGAFPAPRPLRLP